MHFLFGAFDVPDNISHVIDDFVVSTVVDVNNISVLVDIYDIHDSIIVVVVGVGDVTGGIGEIFVIVSEFWASS